MEQREALTAAILLLSRADGKVDRREAEAAWRYARGLGMGPEALLRLSDVREDDVVGALVGIAGARQHAFLAAAFELCLVDAELHPEELRLFSRFAAATGADAASYTGAADGLSAEE